MRVTAIIPALNEEASIETVLLEIPPEIVDEVIVVDGGSSDETANVAARLGAKVIVERARGYGRACAVGSEAAQGEVLVFLDADGADDPTEVKKLLDPIERGQADLVLGSRLRGEIQKGAMPPHQHFGNWLAGALIRLLYRQPITDLAPYRAVRAELLRNLNMADMTYGWPTEMIVKTIRGGYSIVEIPVSYRPRMAGRSKISGTLRGTILAAFHILGTTFRYALKPRTSMRVTKQPVDAESDSSTYS